MNDFFVSAMLLGALATGGNLPFWAVSNQNGLMPDNNGAFALVQAYKPFDESKTFQWEAGASFAANWQPVAPEDLSSSPLHAMVDELYAGARWKVLRADIGMMRREREFLGSDPLLGSLSVTEGHIVESNNARTMPGYKLTLEPWAVPFTNGHLLINGVWGDYKTIDTRWMQDALVHRMQAYLTYDTHNHFYVRLGLDHYAMWGGTSPDGRSMNITVGNYFRVATGRSAGSDGTLSDKMNVIGEHGGAELLRMGWREKDYDITFQWEKPYADKSGMKLHNFPDGVYSLQWSQKDKNQWITDVLLEFHYTLWQSGCRQDSEVDENGNPIEWHPGLVFTGGDNYFTNGEYRCGWTHFGRGICSPLFYTKRYSENLAAIYNTRYRTFHMGVSGRLFRFAPYRLMLTYSNNYGTYYSPLVPGASSWNTDWKWWKKNLWDKPVNQFSAAFNGYVPFEVGRSSYLDIVYGVYADAGKLLNKNFGVTLGVRFKL